MREEGAGPSGAGGVMHCFTESLAVARSGNGNGFLHLVFRHRHLQERHRPAGEVAQAVPLERMLIETDSPYLAPVPFRGKMNQPGWVRHVAEFLATLKGVPLEQVARQTTDNFFNLFRIHA